MLRLEFDKSRKMIRSRLIGRFYSRSTELNNARDPMLTTRHRPQNKLAEEDHN
jgi:hypothetical protein